MAVLGIVAEYDPFHNGHLRHLRMAVSSVKPSAVVVALSGPFKQRGEPSLLSPFSRAACALAAGADAVLALPVLWTVRDAEHYALGAVHLLSSLGATHLAFGAETADLPLLEQAADLLEHPPSPLQDAIRASLAEGIGYPAALAKAAGACIPECGALLDRPNNILAVCYLRAIRRLGLSLIPVVISRSGAYHDVRILPDAPSASALRDALMRGAWPQVLQALPPASEKTIRSAFLSGAYPDSKRLDAMLLEKLRAMNPEQAAALPDCPEGLDRALLNAASRASSREEIVSMMTSRRYSSARISRLCACALLGITRGQLEHLPLPDSALLLALKRNPSLTGSWKSSDVRVVSFSDCLESVGSADRAAWRIWSLACGLPSSFPFTQKMITGI